MGSRRPVLAVATAAAALLLPACGDGGGTVGDRGDTGDAGAAPSAGTTPAPEPTPVDLACPEQLAAASGFDEPADATPSFPRLEAAVVCSYFPGSSPDGGWELQVGPTDVAEDDLAGLDEALADLRPAPADQLCRMDLGPRLLLLAATTDGTVGVVAEDYGCSNVLLTEDPATQAPGSAAGGLAVPGALSDGGRLVETLGTLVRAPGS